MVLKLKKGSSKVSFVSPLSNKVYHFLPNEDVTVDHKEDGEILLRDGRFEKAGKEKTAKN